MKFIMFMTILVSAVAVNAQDYSVGILLLNQERELIGKTSYDYTPWVNSFPSKLNRGKIESVLDINKDLFAVISYQKAATDQKNEKIPAFRDFNIFDFEVVRRGVKTNKVLCYNSIYLKSLKETPYINMECPTIYNNEYLNVKLKYSANKFWIEK